MNLDSKTHSKLIELHYKDIDSGEYTRIVDILYSLTKRQDHEISEM